ncbi:hypothetical protein, conserved in T. vivax [Trypanosoma vivax Y486]|uniref:Uncharacterized protein n=1 Tax=Trypanosoma vivax (strain Y486) TaxID=1055687 RepID=F9WVE8_TRYVY|nr:hypothetical protein, conserved in T. vivax [Trypanosoma vivax Y486]|eukprot:CCD21556.1 hypothetical protein, conserved in T. vivax [Trypanosoma vivax Y486]
MVDGVAACAVCLLAAVPLCTQNHRTRVSAPQTIDAVEIEKAAHVVVGLFKSYNHTFKVLHGRALTVLNETNHSLARCEEMDADIRNFTSHSGASHVVSAVTEALRQAQEAQKMAQDSLKEVLAAFQNVSLTASSMAALCLNKDDHIKVPQQEMEIIRRPLLWNSLIASNYGARQHFNNLTDVMQRVYKNGDEATFVDRTSDGKWENETRQLWQEALHKGKGMVKTLITPVVECRMTELEGSLMGDAVKEQLVSEQVTAIQNVLSNLEASALQRLGSLVLLLRRSYELLHKAQGLQKQAAEKILSAKSSAMCRFHWRIAEEERCIASLKLSASTTSAKISELQVRLDAVVSAAASAKKGVEEAQNITKQQGQAASSTILKCEEVRAVVAHTTKAISTAESSLITARRAAGLAQRAYEVTGSAVEEIDKALVSIKEAQNGYKDTSRAQRNVDESTAATAASLDEVKRISRQPVWPVSYRGYEASHRSCESFNRANAHANEHDEQLLWALGLFEEGRFVSSDLNQLVNNVTKLKELSGLAEAKLQAATASTGLAVKHVDAAKQHVQLALEDGRDGERNRTQAAELSARALREAACEKKNAVCVLMAQLHGLRVNITLLKEQTLLSERAAVGARQRATTYMEVFSALPEYSQLPASEASGSADKTKKAADLAISAAHKTKEGAEEVLASIAAYIAVLTKIFDSIACSDLVPSTDYDACGVAVGGVTEVSLASSVSKYITLQNVTATERVDERLVHLIEKWRAVLAMRKESVLHADSAVGHAAETEKMTMAGQKDMFCRAVDHLRGMTDFIIVLRERAQSGKLATGEAGAKLRVLEDSLESAKQKVASVEAMVKDAAAAVSSSGSAANEVRIASASVARAKAAADTSLTNANKAVEEVRNAKVIIDSSQRDVSSAQKIVAATNGTCSEVMMVLERVDSDLKSMETRLADAQKTLSDSATELSGDGAINMQSDCTVLRAAAPLESAEY